MKFGKQIKRMAEESQFGHCIAYDVLKKAIGVVIEGDKNSQNIKEVNEAFGHSTEELSGVGRPPDSRFHTLLQHELAKINRYAHLQIRTLLDTLREAQKLAKQLDTMDPAPPEEVTKLERLLENAADQLVAFENFRRLNFTGFRKIAKKFDKRCAELGTGEGSLASWFLPMLLREFFVAEPLDSHIQVLGLGYAAVRAHRKSMVTPAVKPAGKVPPTTTTFWLTPTARIRTLCSLIRRFELVVPGAHRADRDLGAVPVGEQMRRLLLTMAPDGPARGPCRLRSHSSQVYYDGAHFTEYSARMNAGGPRGFRVRNTSATHQVGSELVERDGAHSAVGAHAFTPVSELVFPDAFPLYPGGLEAATAAAGRGAGPGAILLSATRYAATCKEASGLGGSESEELASFAWEVQADSQSAGQGGLQPMAVVSSSRVVLRGDTAGTEGISIAIDEDVQFSQQIIGPAATAPNNAIDFPYCLLEVSTEVGWPSGGWLEHLKSYAALRSVQGFSVGVQAVAALHKDKVPALPEWFKHLSSLENSTPPEAWGLLTEWRQAVNDDDPGAAEREAQMQEAGKMRLEPPPPEPAKTPTAVVATAGEPGGTGATKTIMPKNFLASERTMLEWIHTVLALAFMGIALWRISLSMTSEGGMTDRILLGLLNRATGSSLVLGVYALALVAIALGFAWYSVLTHTMRLRALKDDSVNAYTEGMFNTRKGPAGFAVILGVALFSHLVVQVVPLCVALASGEVSA